MISYNEVKPGVAVLIEGEPYVCTWNNIMKKQQRRPVNQTKMRHIIKGKVSRVLIINSHRIYVTKRGYGFYQYNLSHLYLHNLNRLL